LVQAVALTALLNVNSQCRLHEEPKPTKHYTSLVGFESMKRVLSEAKEEKCPACGGTGVEPVKQQPPPGRRIYPPKCKVCGGKGRTKKPATEA
jgi:DnaJ-class molecular chaperone